MAYEIVFSLPYVAPRELEANARQLLEKSIAEESSVLPLSLTASYHTGAPLQDLLRKALESCSNLRIDLPLMLIVHNRIMDELATPYSDFESQLTAFMQQEDDYQSKIPIYKELCTSLHNECIITLMEWVKKNADVFRRQSVRGSNFAITDVSLNPAWLEKEFPKQSGKPKASYEISLWQDWESHPLYNSLHDAITNDFLNSQKIKKEITIIIDRVLMSKDSLNKKLKAKYHEHTDAAKEFARFACSQYILAELTVMVLWRLLGLYGNLIYPANLNPVCSLLFSLAEKLAKSSDIQQIFATSELQASPLTLKLIDSVRLEKGPQAQTAPIAIASSSKPKTSHSYQQSPPETFHDHFAQSDFLLAPTTAPKLAPNAIQLGIAGLTSALLGDQSIDEEYKIYFISAVLLRLSQAPQNTQQALQDEPQPTESPLFSSSQDTAQEEDDEESVALDQQTRPSINSSKSNTLNAYMAATNSKRSSSNSSLRSPSQPSSPQEAQQRKQSRKGF